jgi:hypothetical protein
MTCGSALAACAASTPDAPTTNHNHRRPPGGDPFCKQTAFRDLADMKPPLGQRPRWSAPTARTRTAKFAPFSHPLRQPKDRRSMHPSRPLEADWVARWRLASAGHAGRTEGGQAKAALRAAPAPIPTRSCMRTAMVAAPTRPAPPGESRRARTPANPGRRVSDRPRQAPRAKTSGADK